MIIFVALFGLGLGIGYLAWHPSPDAQWNAVFREGITIGCPLLTRTNWEANFEQIRPSLDPNAGASMLIRVIPDKETGPSFFLASVSVKGGSRPGSLFGDSCLGGRGTLP